MYHVHRTVLVAIHPLGIIACVCVCVCARARVCMCAVTQSCLNPCNPIDCSSLGSSVHGIFYWNELPFPTPGHLPYPGIEPVSLFIFCVGRQILYDCHLSKYLLLLL